MQALHSMADHYNCRLLLQSLSSEKLYSSSSIACANFDVSLFSLWLLLDAGRLSASRFVPWLACNATFSFSARACTSMYESSVLIQCGSNDVWHTYEITSNMVPSWICQHGHDVWQTYEITWNTVSSWICQHCHHVGYMYSTQPFSPSCKSQPQKAELWKSWECFLH